MDDLLSGAGLHRLDDRRGDPSLLDPDTRVVTVHGSRALLAEDGVVTERLEGLELDPAGLVLLGDREGARYAARSVPEEELEALEQATGGRFAHLRSAVASLPAWQAGLVSYAAALLAWHEGSRFCGECGAPTRSASAGHRRECTGCDRVQFPRTDPAIITLVRRGDRALLARQPGWPEGLFSTLAGFVEPGESLEQAVGREVAEEVGLPVVRTEYYASQPWPFPHSLMIGYRTEVGAGEVVLGDELEESRWFDRSELRSAIDDGSVAIPPPLALSRSLIDDWLGRS